MEKGFAEDHAKSLNREGNGVVNALVEGEFDTPSREPLYFPVGLDCNITLYQVTSNTTVAAPCRPNAPLKRILAFVLLAFVTYTATAEAVHRHGGFLLVAQASSATALSPSDDASSSANDSRANGECLICQLRQQLSFTLLNAPLLVVAPQAQVARAQATALPSFSRPDAPQRGRAPPLASLI
jgi:hypothetical protein